MSRQDNRSGAAAGCTVLVAAFVLMAGFTPATAATQDAAPLHAMSHAFESLTSRISPAVVEILVNGYGPDDPEKASPDSPIGPVSSQGSGVIVDPNGYIVTNYHVVNGEQSVKVVITPQEGREPQAPAALRRRSRILPAKVVGYSKQADLAVLKVDATGLPTIAFAKYTQLQQGQLVLALGSPIGLQNSVSLGLVSSVLRQDDPESPMVYIQTDAAINPGNSGGALVDVDGNLVGINSSILTKSGGNEGIGFAIPSGIVQFVYDQIRQYGYVRNGYIGATVQAITPELAAALALPETSLHGVIVSDVFPDSPAAGAGLQPYDRIVSIDGADVDSVPAFAMNIYLRGNGDRVRLGVARGNKTLSIVVPVKEVKPGPSGLADLADPGKNLIPQLGIVGVDLSHDVADFVGQPRIDSGVVIAATTTDQRADDIGLQFGDIIHAVNAKPVADMDDLEAVLRDLKPGDQAVLQVERDGRLRLLTFAID
ncbi:MAG TPA: trypsin-like peptidase domain-containing protein [Rhodanobacteraceae bacterium]|nr:trypsin-like peptidase domain-containing protein [Rhodanobacteraceae bacterium]